MHFIASIPLLLSSDMGLSVCHPASLHTAEWVSKGVLYVGNKTSQRSESNCKCSELFSSNGVSKSSHNAARFASLISVNGVIDRKVCWRCVAVALTVVAAIFHSEVAPSATD